jgi:hypothetical protein
MREDPLAHRLLKGQKRHFVWFFSNQSVVEHLNVPYQVGRGFHKLQPRYMAILLTNQVDKSVIETSNFQLSTFVF